MPTQIGELGVTFPDATLQTTAAVPGAPGFGIPNMAVITSSSFWTVPAGVTRVRVTVVGGGGGANAGFAGTSGGTSSFGAFCSATGGGPGSGSGGTGISGTINFSGQAGSALSVDGIPNSVSWGLLGGASIFGGSYGCGGAIGGGTVGGGGSAYAGSGGGAVIKIITGLTPGQAISVTVGAGGIPQPGTGQSVNSGNAGVVIVEY